MTESAIVGKHNQKENHELPITVTCNKSSSQTLKPSDNLSGNIYIMYYILFLFLLKKCYIYVYILSLMCIIIMINDLHD